MGIVVGGGLGFLGLVLYVPWLAELFGFASPTAPGLVVAVVAGLVSVLWLQAISLLRRPPERARLP
jgi:Ca2+-transporting ATPase